MTDSTPPQPHQAPEALSPRSWIHLVAPRDSAHARLPDGRVYDAPPGTPLGDILDVARREGTSATADAPAVAAIVDGRLRELHTPLVRDADVTPVTLADSDGARIYRRSLAFLLVTAASETFPEADVIVEHSAPTVGGYFCAVSGRDPFSAEELRTLERRMREIVERDEPIVKSRGAGHPGGPAVPGSGRDRQGAADGTPAQRDARAVRVARQARLFSGLHGALDRTAARVRARVVSARIPAAVSASGDAARARAGRALSAPARSLRRSGRVASDARHCQHRRAERRDCRRAPAAAGARSRGASRSPDRAHRAGHRGGRRAHPRRL